MASAWQALTCLAVAKAKEERSTLNAQRSTLNIETFVTFVSFCQSEDKGNWNRR
jgi:hypothetical protein